MIVSFGYSFASFRVVSGYSPINVLSSVQLSIYFFYPVVVLCVVTVFYCVLCPFRWFSIVFISQC